MTDPRTLADRLEAALPLIGAAGHHVLLSLCHDAAALLRDLADENDRLDTANARDIFWAKHTSRLTAERDAAEYRLSALLDAIGDPEGFFALAMTLIRDGWEGES